MTTCTTAPDIFEEIRQHYDIPAAWAALRLPGEPKQHGNMRSPLRDERTPSFSIHDGGRAFKDHGTGLGGDVIEFIKVALGCDYEGVRDWGKVRFGIDALDGRKAPSRPARAPAKLPEQWTPIEWPGELVEGTLDTWTRFAAQRGFASAAGVSLAVRGGYLRFLRIRGRACYCVTDSTRRAAEIRDWSGRLFGESKAYWLKGVSKRWLPGLAHVATAKRDAGIFITEGATDLLTALDCYHDWKTQGGASSWIPAAILGAGCKSLAPEAEGLVRGRRVRLAPDGDEAGDAMAQHWREVFKGLGCTVDVLKLPRGKDLSDVAGRIKLEGLFGV